MPELVVSGAVDAGERLPLFQELPEPVNSMPPVVASGQCLCLIHHGLFRGDGVGVLLSASGFAGLDLGREQFLQGVQPRRQSCKIAHGIRLGDVGARCGDGLPGLFGGHRLGLDTRDEQRHLGSQVLVAPRVERQGLFGGRIGDLPNTSLCVTDADVDGAVGIDATKLRGRLLFAHAHNLAVKPVRGQTGVNHRLSRRHNRVPQ